MAVYAPAVRPHDLDSLRAFIAGDPLLQRAEASPDDLDPGHDVAHAHRVAVWTLRLAPDEPARACIAAALLHDAVNVPKDSPERSSASTLSAELARTILEPHLDPAIVDRIADAIRDHSYSRGARPTTALGRALQDADRLEALGALGLCRTLSCGARMGAQYFDPHDPWAADRELQDTKYTVDHFFTKLLKLPATMCTEAGRAEAERRVAFMRAFLDQLSLELGVPHSTGRAMGN